MQAVYNQGRRGFERQRHGSRGVLLLVQPVIGALVPNFCLGTPLPAAPLRRTITRKKMLTTLWQSEHKEFERS